MRQRGFSLVEVLAALVVLTIVITTSLAVFTERNRRLQQASEMILAYQALSNEAEMQRRVDYVSLTSGGFQTDPVILAPLSPFTAEVTVTNDPKPNIRNVTMTITWKGGLRKAKLSLVRADTGGSNLW